VGDLTSVDDDSLIAAARRGDGHAWTVVVDRYGQLVWSIGRRCGLSAADAEDLVQAVFTILLRRLPHLEDPSRLAGWLGVTARREAWRLSSVSRRTSGADIDHADVAADDDSILEVEERHQAVRMAMTRLGERCRNLLTDLFGRSEVLSYESVAERLGISINSVGPIRRRCLDELLDQLRRHSAEMFDATS
jgi:RNA polymerase sigma factor (sigma-70 family)